MLTSYSYESATMSTKNPLVYENLVLEGGGAKGVALGGALKYLQKLGLLSGDGNHHIKRFGGASIGALVASLLSVGYSPDEVSNILYSNSMSTFTSGTLFSICLSFYEVFKQYGFHSTNPIKKSLGEYIKQKTGNADLTFKQLYTSRDKELCVIVTNVNRLKTEYFHAKTTPDTPIREAVRMSISIPGYFRAIKSKLEADGEEDLFVDGGMLCNYPIHCFDGWFLSMAKGNSFFNRIKSLSDIAKHYEQNNRFKEFNPKTLGIVLYSETDNQWMKDCFNKRALCLKPERPGNSTKLYCERDKSRHKSEEIEQYDKLRSSVEVFFKVCQEHLSESTLSKEAVKIIFEDKRFTQEQRDALFEGLTFEEFFSKLDQNNDGTVQFRELLGFIEWKGVYSSQKYMGFDRKNITDLKTFVSSLIGALVQNSQMINLQPRDIDRTIAINTSYVGTLDFELEDADKEFLEQRGSNAAKAFFDMKHTNECGCSEEN
ncbi:uncharacterized protein LOC126831913 isoform X1 [Patella vulgata]|uniref:uncharacterized protein LOC126831913 isoform X1 n=2 Tax=Patella vulgata TaxID=6465 RepID=UPI0021807B6F|nr:uncharacterized protein LOC126831913 isoform X1 [Patella vulgata]